MSEKKHTRGFYQHNEYVHKTAVLALTVLPIVGTLLAMVYLWNRVFFLSDLILLVSLYSLTVLGITVGFHRMLTHTSFRAPAPIKFLLLVFGTMAFEGPPLSWAATHIKHHAHSDEEGDPHSPLDGFWHAHMGWMFSQDHFDDAEVYAPHLLQDPIVMFVNRWTFVWMLLSLVLPAVIGGWTGFLWGGAVRIFLTTHVTWSVNSICHTFGRRDFSTTDESRNHWIVGLLAFGEGWHNNHHAFPTNAYHGMRWWQIDFSGWLIRSMELLGIVKEVQRVSPEMEAAHQVRAVKTKTMTAELRRQLTEMINHAKEELSELSDEVMDRWKAAEGPEKTRFAQAYARLEEIQRIVTTATNLKRQKLNAYMKEVQELAEDTKAMLKRKMARA